MNEIDEVAELVVARSKEPRTFEFWGRNGNAGWRVYAITIENGHRTFFVQRVPFPLEAIEESDLQVFAHMHATWASNGSFQKG